MKRAYIATFIATSALALSVSFASAQTMWPQAAGEDMSSVVGGLILVRDARAAMGGGSGGYNKGSCWKACFEEYNICVDRTAKNICVPQMKSCLAVCDSISGGN